MKCPRDQHELVDRSMDDLPIHKCPDCFGLWISMPVILSLAKAENLMSLVHIIETSDFSIASLPLGKLVCPDDDRIMHYSVIHNVELDICPSCRGVWLDRGEFDSATFRERFGWTEHKEPKDNLPQLLFDTIAYTPEWAGNLNFQIRGLKLDILRIIAEFLFSFLRRG